MGKAKDAFVNTAYGTVTESAAGALTFSEIQTNISIFEKIAWVISRIEWYLPPATIALIIGAPDLWHMALTASNNLTALALNAAAVIDLYEWGAGSTNLGQPLVRDFSSLPGGGKIVAPRPLYVALLGDSMASAGSVQCRINFTSKIMTDAEYIELIDFYRIVQ